ncbi:MAG: hypothetical protein WKF82_05065 [Nocardioidaceae bacterium]
MSATDRLVARHGSSQQAPDPLASPPARRVRVTRWRDPKMLFGLVLVLGSVVVGAKVLAAADDSVAVWQLDQAVIQGTVLTGDDLRTTRIRFADDALLDRYLLADEIIPTGALAVRDLAAGELLSDTAVTTSGESSLRLLPLDVGSGGIPAGLAAGDHVEVWALTELEDLTQRSAPTQVFADATVMSLGAGGSPVAGATSQVSVAMPPDAEVAEALSSLNGARVVLVRIGA